MQFKCVRLSEEYHAKLRDELQPKYVKWHPDSAHRVMSIRELLEICIDRAIEYYEE